MPKMWKLKSLVAYHSSARRIFIFGGYNLNLLCYQFQWMNIAVVYSCVCVWYGMCRYTKLITSFVNENTLNRVCFWNEEQNWTNFDLHTTSKDATIYMHLCLHCIVNSLSARGNYSLQHCNFAWNRWWAMCDVACTMYDERVCVYVERCRVLRERHCVICVRRWAQSRVSNGYVVHNVSMH